MPLTYLVTCPELAEAVQIFLVLPYSTLTAGHNKFSKNPGNQCPRNYDQEDFTSTRGSAVNTGLGLFDCTVGAI